MRRLMREEGLEVVYNRRRRRWSSYAGEVSAAPPNLVARDFSAPAPDELWVTDITEFRIPAGKAYLSAVVDCFDGRPAGWRIGPSPTAALANGSLADAVAARRAGAPAAGARRLWEALLASSRSGRRLPAGEDVAVRMLAREIASLDADIEELDSLVADSLAGDEVYECLLTVPGIGPKTAAALVTSIDISAFRGHDELASYCGVAPSDRRSGSSIRSTSPQRGGNRQLKNLLIFSCNSLIGTDNRFGRYYGECRARGMRHSKALKAVARKRLKVIYAIMRDAVPYAA